MAGSVLLEDNSPSDRQLYAVTIDTGLRSRPTMTAKVHIVLHGEGGASQTRELSFSDQLLFDRNSRHTFILSTPDNLGPIWKLHLWHTNGGPSPSWYLSHVVVRDLTRGGSWFFPGSAGWPWMKLLHLKLTEYLEDFHSWASVYSRPSHSRFTRVQRLSVCLLLLEGYMCANAALVSLQNDQYTAELGLIDVSTVSLATGILSTLAVLPVGGLVSLLFRLCKASGNKYCSRQQYKTRIPEIYSVEAHRDALLVDGSISESCHSLQECTQEKWRMQCKVPIFRGVAERRSPSQASMRYRELHMEKQGQATAWNSSGGFEDGSSNSKPMDKDCKQSQHNLQSGCTAEHSCALGRREHRSGRVVLPSWCRHVTWALCSSLTLVCIVITGGLGIRFSPTKSLLWIHSLFFSMLCCFFVVQPALILIIATAVSLWYKDRCDFYCCSDETETAGGLQEHWSHNGGRLSEIYPLSLHQHPQNQYTHFDRVLAARQRARHLRLTRPPTPADLKDTRDRMKKELLIRKILSPGERVLGQPEPSTDPALSGSHRHCGHVACYEGAGTRVSLGPTRAEASVRLQELWDRGWLDRYTQAVMVQFTLYNPPTSLFTSVSLLTEQPSAGGLLPSTFIESIRVYQTAGPLHYSIMACELLFLLLILLHLYLQIFTMSQKGLLAYWRDIRNWLEVTIIIISLLYYICYVNHFILAVEIIDLWQRENFKSFVDLGFLSSWEQLTRCLHGLMLFLLLLRCVFLLQTNRTMAPSVTLLKLSFRKLLWPLVAGVILAIAFASLGNVLFLSSSCHFSGLIRSFQTVITHCLGISQLKAPSALYQPNNGSVTLLCGSFLFSVSIVWTALITGILTSLAKTAKKTSSRKYLVTFSEVAAYTQDRLLVFLGKRKENWRDNHTQRSHFYFDEFENLVDELLFRVNALSNSLHHTLPCGEQGYREGYSSPMSHSEYICSLNSQRAISREDRMRSSVGKSTSEMEEMISKNNPDIYRLLLPSGDDSSYENHFRTKLELEALCHLQQSQHSNRTSSGGSVVSSGPLHTERPEGVSTWAIPESSAVLPGSIEAPETPNDPSPRSDHYNLAQLGDDLPHVLCGARCPEKQTALSGTLESQVSRSTTDLMAKNRKLLRRSHATVIRPLGGGRDGAVSQENLEAGSTLCSDPEPSSLKAAFWTEEPTA
ncbi:hypothetical protein ANANG_G00079160 [Anguilla anguilla]|uniref:PLAT domain-containing protein n=1 Tax=Anguilla anguilla TaxID=7936 RepID=A0A9D3MMR2_ANGAN|nr:hypothetical protein ANANG_G00079160 [Anguilla anguilla]